MSCSDGTSFAPGSGNAEDLRYQDWIAAGNTPLPYETPTPDRKAELVSQISILDIKRIRPLAEGDTEYLLSLNTQIKSLRDELKTL